MERDLKCRLDSIERFLDPETARFRLIAASVYIATYEVLRGTIVDRPRNFFADKYTNVDGDFVAVESVEYKRKVRVLDKNLLAASLKFWRDDLCAITDDDLKAFEGIRKCRAKLAHRLLGVLVSEGLPECFAEHFQKMTALHHKIECWWFANVEAAISEDVPANADLSNALSGEELALGLLTKAALGSPEEAVQMLKSFRDARAKAGLG